MAMIARGLTKMLKWKRFDPNKFYEKGYSLKKKEKSSKDNKPLDNKNESNLGPCFGCSLPGHVVKDCPILQKKVEKHKQKAKKEFKKATIAAWSDSDSSNSENEEQATNLFFMVNEDQVQEDETEYKSRDEVDCSDLLESSTYEFAQALTKCIRCEPEHLYKIKSLKKIACDLSFEKEVLQKSKTANLTQDWNSCKRKERASIQIW